MKNLIVSLMSVSSLAFACPDTKIDGELNPNKFYVSPEFSVNLVESFHFHDGIADVKGHQWGAKLGYEYNQPYSFYTGLEGSIASGSARFDVNNFYGDREILDLDSSRIVVRGRVGYSLRACDFDFIPFTGMGGIRWECGSYLEKVAYLPVGFKVLSPVWYHLSSGISFEHMQYLYVSGKWANREESKWIVPLNRSGYEISLPISVHDLPFLEGGVASIEPFFFKFSDRHSIVGGRISASFGF